MGTTVALGLIIIFFFISIAAIATSVNIEKVDSAFVSENSILNLNLNLSVRDRSPAFNPFQFLSEKGPSIVGMDAIIGSINNCLLYTSDAADE